MSEYYAKKKKNFTTKKKNIHHITQALYSKMLANLKQTKKKKLNETRKKEKIQRRRIKGEP